MANPASPDFFTIKQIAERLQVSERTVHRLISSGHLRSYRIGANVRISAADLRNFLTECHNG